VQREMASSRLGGVEPDVLQAYLAARYAQLQKEIAHRAAVSSREPHLSGSGLNAVGTSQAAAVGSCHAASAHPVDASAYIGVDIETWYTQAIRCRDRAEPALPSTAALRQMPCDTATSRLHGLRMSAVTKTLSDLSTASTKDLFFSGDAPQVGMTSPVSVLNAH